MNPQRPSEPGLGRTGGFADLSCEGRRGQIPSVLQLLEQFMGHAPQPTLTQPQMQRKSTLVAFDD